MKSKLLNSDNPRVYALIFEKGDEVTEGLRSFGSENKLSASHFSAIGAFSEVVLGFFDFSIKDYKKITVGEQVEVLNLSGDITFDGEGGIQVHAHVVVGKQDGTAHGGHLLSAKVHPTLEVILTESPGYLSRKKDEETGLTLISI